MSRPNHDGKPRKPGKGSALETPPSARKRGPPKDSKGLPHTGENPKQEPGKGDKKRGVTRENTPLKRGPTPKKLKPQKKKKDAPWLNTRQQRGELKRGNSLRNK